LHETKKNLFIKTYFGSDLFVSYVRQQFLNSAVVAAPTGRTAKSELSDSSEDDKHRYATSHAGGRFCFNDLELSRSRSRSRSRSLSFFLSVYDFSFSFIRTVSLFLFSIFFSRYIRISCFYILRLSVSLKFSLVSSNLDSNIHSILYCLPTLHTYTFSS
jgi:hypothetical protein